MGQILSQTDGIPLFIEELTKTLLESRILREGPDKYEMIGPYPSQAIPKTLQGSLLARLDRLGPAKEVAQIGAVIGREFAHQFQFVVAVAQPQLFHLRAIEARRSSAVSRASSERSTSSTVNLPRPV